MSAVYRPPIEKATTRPGAWLNPRRRYYVEKLLAFLLWHGSKVWFRDERYDDIRAEQGVDRYATNQAIDDAYTLGAVDVEMAAGGVPIVTALVRDLDTLAAAKPNGREAVTAERRRVI